jgi:glutamate dehydrogenase/leucine dehydrogenase
MAWIRDEIGRAVGLPREIGGIPLDEIGATGRGLLAAARAAERAGAVRLDGARVAIQGYGAVGRWAARFLAEAGAVIVAVSDSRGAVMAEEGLDLARLDAAKAEGASVAQAAGGAVRAVALEAVVTAACDILVPAARPDVIHEGNVDRVRARIVLEGANIPATEAAERRLHGRGVLVIPDFIANAGGVICAAVEHRRGSRADAEAAIEARIGDNVAAVLTRAATDGTPPRDAALSMALERVRRASAFRR